MNVFEITYIKANSSRSHVILTFDNMEQVNVGGNIIGFEKKTVMLLGITVDNKLSFEPHLNITCKTVSQNLHAFARLSTHILQKKLKMIMRVIIIT